ncbi:hypothetical protein BJV74DRAFT_880179 [Russula compacta]|nr:hypothetical protein BJV74DRAFT_880179 [Russula compacta]
MSAGDINELLDIWAASLFQHRDHPPFADHNDLYVTINAIPHGDIPWQSNPDFDGEFDYILYKEYDPNNDHRFQNFFSGDWVWEQVDKIAKDPTTRGSTFVLIFLSSDKTTISVATGNNKYYPLYTSIGNIYNNVHHAHHNGVVLVGFLAIPKIHWCSR